MTLRSISVVIFCAMMLVGVPPMWAFAETSESRVGGASSQRATRSSDWPTSSGNLSGHRFSRLEQIDGENVASLELAWIHRVALEDDARTSGPRAHFETTPILVGNRLVFCTPRSRVVSIDPESGEVVWSFDPDVESAPGPGAEGERASISCRGVASHQRVGAEGLSCSRRILVATSDARLIALDTETGEPCSYFGRNGTVEVWHGIAQPDRRGEIGISSPPIVVGDVAIVGSSIGSNPDQGALRGPVRAYHAVHGEKLWEWDAIPREPRDPTRVTWAGNEPPKSGAANVWSLATADPARDLVFVPTSSPSPAGFGGARLGENRHANSLVALRASTGEFVWAFQTVHHDVWDYDLAAQPLLIDFEFDGRRVAAVAQATPTGHLFVLDRETGEPIFPVAETAAPGSDVPGELLAPTQPVPTWPPALVSAELEAGDAWGVTPVDRWFCRTALESLRTEGPFTPPSLEGSLRWAGLGGAVGPESVAWDPIRKLLIANVSNVAHRSLLLPREPGEVAVDLEDGDALGALASPESPFRLRVESILSPIGLPCNPPPWGRLIAIDLAAQLVRWARPLGTTWTSMPLVWSADWGAPNRGGALVTASGLVFIAATSDAHLRAFDAESGERVYEKELPLPGYAAPMTYLGPTSGAQFVVVALSGAESGDEDRLVAFRLPTVDPPTNPSASASVGDLD